MPASHLKLFFCLTLLLSWFLFGCQADFSESAISPSYEFIAEYAISKNGENLALLVPERHYHRRAGGLSDWQIIVFNKANPDGRQVMKGVNSSPQYLQFSPDGDALYMINHDFRTENPRLIILDIESDETRRIQFDHRGFALSGSGEQIVAWGKRNNLLMDDGLLTLYDIDTMVATNTVSTYFSGIHHAIRQVSWAFDERSLLILGRDSEARYSFLEIDLETNKQNVINAPQFSNQFIWDSETNIILASQAERLTLFHADSECVLLQIPRDYALLSNNSFVPPIYSYRKESRFLFNSSYQIFELSFEDSFSSEHSCRGVNDIDE